MNPKKTIKEAMNKYTCLRDDISGATHARCCYMKSWKCCCLYLIHVLVNSLSTHKQIMIHCSNKVYLLRFCIFSFNTIYSEGL